MKKHRKRSTHLPSTSPLILHNYKLPPPLPSFSPWTSSFLVSSHHHFPQSAAPHLSFLSPPSHTHLCFLLIRIDSMFRLGQPTTTLSSRWQQQENWARLLAPLTLWICVSISLQFGYYGNYRMLLGPSSSRLLKTSPVFVKRVEVTDFAKKGVFIYGFDQGKPQLSLETNWTVSKYLIVSSYSRQGFSLWLNEGSRIHMKWEAHTSSTDHLQIVVIKGERNFETLTPFSFAASGNKVEGNEADYVITEGDKYYVSVLNSNQRSIILTMNMNVTSKMYDTTKASSVCSTTDGSCRLNLLFPNTQYVVLTTPNNGDLAGWYIELSFVSRIVTYVAILGFIVIIIFLILKYLGACNGDNDGEDVTITTYHTVPTTAPETTAPEQSETDPLIPKKPTRLTYGTSDEDLEVGSPSDGSSDAELYDGKICVICYDEPRNCFFVPCGHCATCHDCALRILEGESRVCPICRRMIHKVRRLYTP